MDHASAARRITGTLFAAQSLASAAIVAIFPVVRIIEEEDRDFLARLLTHVDASMNGEKLS